VETKEEGEIMNKQKEAEEALSKIDDFLGYTTVNAKFMLIPREPGTLIIGGLFSDKLLSSKEYELWVAELHIRPAHKFVGLKEEGYKGLDFNQLLASGWSNTDNWKRKLL